MCQGMCRPGAHHSQTGSRLYAGQCATYARSTRHYCMFGLHMDSQVYTTFALGLHLAYNCSTFCLHLVYIVMW